MQQHHQQINSAIHAVLQLATQLNSTCFCVLTVDRKQIYATNCIAFNSIKCLVKIVFVVFVVIRLITTFMFGFAFGRKDLPPPHLHVSTDSRLRPTTVRRSMPHAALR